MGQKADKEKAFTLIELLIVVAIIAVLAAIAVPNFLEAQTRAKVSRTAADMRTLLTALESYHVDHNNYPYRQNPSPFKLIAPLLSTRIEELSVLTTPIGYITGLPRDIFDRAVESRLNAIDYYDEDQTEWFTNSGQPFFAPKIKPGWLMISVGPDGYLGVLPGGGPGGYPPQGLAKLTFKKVYDPTNGTISRGNIFRFQGDRDPQKTLHP